MTISPVPSRRGSTYHPGDRVRCVRRGVTYTGLYGVVQDVRHREFGPATLVVSFGAWHTYVAPEGHFSKAGVRDA